MGGALCCCGGGAFVSDSHVIVQH